MDSDRLRNWRRWVASEHENREEEADAAFRALFKAVPVQMPGSEFGSRVARATAQAAARQARLVRLAVLAGVVCAIALAVVLVMQIPRLVQASLDVVIGATVSTTLALSRGGDVWTMLAHIARAVGSVIVTPQGTYVLSGLGLVAIGALYALQRLLELEERSSL